MSWWHNQQSGLHDPVNFRQEHIKYTTNNHNLIWVTHNSIRWYCIHPHLGCELCIKYTYFLVVINAGNTRIINSIKNRQYRYSCKWNPIETPILHSISSRILELLTELRKLNTDWKNKLIKSSSYTTVLVFRWRDYYCSYLYMNSHATQVRRTRDSSDRSPTWPPHCCIKVQHCLGVHSE